MGPHIIIDKILKSPSLNILYIKMKIIIKILKSGI